MYASAIVADVKLRRSRQGSVSLKGGCPMKQKYLLVPTAAIMLAVTSFVLGSLNAPALEAAQHANPGCQGAQEASTHVPSQAESIIDELVHDLCLGPD